MLKEIIINYSHLINYRTYEFRKSSSKLKKYIKNNHIFIIIINSITNQSCDHAVLKSSIYAEKSERSKNSHLNLLYTYCSSSTVCSNYLASAVSTFLDYESHEFIQVSEFM